VTATLQDLSGVPSKALSPSIHASSTAAVSQYDIACFQFTQSH
jgi:hypothetical protein